MNNLLCFAGLVLAVVLSAQQPDAPAVAPAAATAAKLSPEEIVAEREKYVQEVLAAIKGREKEPAEAVFKNIQRFKGVPAGRLPMIMNMGFSRSLGVSCTHCHMPGEWDKEDKPQKQIAREMAAMADKISRELLPAIKNLDSKQPTVNCTTCHRGEVRPALDLPGTAPRAATPPPAKAPGE
ncbi:MAG: hypothetical protein C0502_08530 [Opitutus sp.]|nr:hypothetical protein [Opitutus sp.]